MVFMLVHRLVFIGLVEYAQVYLFSSRSVLTILITFNKNQAVILEYFIKRQIFSIILEISLWKSNKNE